MLGLVLTLGCLEDVAVQVTVYAKAKPMFFKPKSVPFLLREKME